ncbi:MAG: DUF2490 domain-containing protein [Bacteroidota bacterium]|nr:DUF2490 domain-containing protein [Bacteroidota bacterium]
MKTNCDHLFLWRRRSLYCALILIFPIVVIAQSGPLGSWSIINTKISFNKRWSAFAEGQLRSVKFYDDFFYFEIKGGLTYNLTEQIAMTAGAGRYHTYTTSQSGDFVEPLTQGETRTWVQVSMEQLLDRVHFEHRYRAEQRFTTNGYRNRFRYRLNVFFPINRRELVPKTIYASVSDEVFFFDKAPYYERNRFYAGLGYKASSTVAFQAGYMRQFDYKIEKSSHRNFLQASLLFSFRLKEQKEPSIPSTTD